MDIYTKLGQLENQLTFLVDITEGNGTLETSGQCISATFLNLLKQVQTIQHDLNATEKKPQSS